MNVSTKLQGPQVAVEKPLVLSPEQATGIMIEALTMMAQQATMTTECLDLIAEYFQKKGIQEGLFNEKDFTEEKEEKSE
jgi:hypothetical protein